MYIDDIKQRTINKVKQKEKEEKEKNKISEIIDSIKIEIENEADFGRVEFKIHIPRSLRQEINKHFSDIGFLQIWKM